MAKVRSEVAAMKTILYFYESAFTMWRRRMAGICEEAGKKGWRIQPVNVDVLSGAARGVLDYWKPVGVIVDGGTLNRAGFGVGNYSKVPAVFCDADRKSLGRPSYRLKHDSDDTARIAARELVSLNSESLGYVSYHTSRDWSDSRRKVLEKIGKEDGVPVSTFDSVAARAGADIGVFLNRLAGFIRSLVFPAGILAANDEMAALVLAAAESAGVSVPEELAVIGIDNDELICENTHPTLSSVAPDFERSGRLAVQLLSRCIDEGGANPETVMYGAAQLMRRRSTRMDAERDPRIVRALEFIRRNACSGATAKDVVAVIGQKERSAENRFKAVCGHSIRDALLAVRLDRAKRLLADTDLPISAVCQECGYSDERSLRYLFAKATGRSPNEWRAQHGL